MIVNIYIGDTKLSLFEDENIELKSSLANINDITKQNTDFTRSFTVPADNINNRLFKHYYNADIDNSFDARTKVDGYIEMGGLPFKKGKFRLEKVTVEKGKPKAYTINFWGNTVSIKDKIKDDELSSLDFSMYDHQHTSENVIQGLRNSLFGNSIIYVPLSKRQYYYNSDPSDNVNTETFANIASNGGGINGLRYSELKPAIKLINIIEAIEQKYNILFSRHFFGRSEFTEAYMWLNQSSEKTIVPYESKINVTYNNASGIGFDTATSTWNNSSFMANPANFRYFIWRVLIVPDAGYLDIPYKIVVRNFGEKIFESDENTGNFITDEQFINTAENTPFSLTFHIVTTQTFRYQSQISTNQYVFLGSTVTNAGSANFTQTVPFVISNNMPKLKITDFLTGLFKLFKLVVVPTDTNEAYVNTLKDYYASGRIWELTRFVDFEKIEVKRGKILNEINYKFENPITILNKQFKANNGEGYGDDSLKLADENGELLDGDKLDVSVPFEMIVYERLNDLDDGLRTNFMYGLVTDESLKPNNPKAHIFYRARANQNAKPIAIINDVNTEIVINYTINIASHTLGLQVYDFSLIFGREFSEWNNSLVTKTLYENYWKDYILSIFNIKKRESEYECKNIPITTLTKLQLNDVIKIKESYFRINDSTTNLNTGEVKLNLINSFDNNISQLLANTNMVNIESDGGQRSVYVSGEFENIPLSDDWVSAERQGNNIFLDISENETGETRIATISIIGKKDSNKNQDVIIMQL